jgi:hypothetical protein
MQATPETITRIVDDPDCRERLSKLATENGIPTRQVYGHGPWPKARDSFRTPGPLEFIKTASHRQARQNMIDDPEHCCVTHDLRTSHEVDGRPYTQPGTAYQANTGGSQELSKAMDAWHRSPFGKSGLGSYHATRLPEVRSANDARHCGYGFTPVDFATYGDLVNNPPMKASPPESRCAIPRMSIVVAADIIVDHGYHLCYEV